MGLPTKSQSSAIFFRIVRNIQYDNMHLRTRGRKRSRQAGRQAGRPGQAGRGQEEGTSEV
jgi:hypothetical protein